MEANIIRLPQLEVAPQSLQKSKNNPRPNLTLNKKKVKVNRQEIKKHKKVRL